MEDSLNTPNLSSRWHQILALHDYFWTPAKLLCPLLTPVSFRVNFFHIEVKMIFLKENLITSSLCKGYLQLLEKKSKSSTGQYDVLTFWPGWTTPMHACTRACKHSIPLPLLCSSAPNVLGWFCLSSQLYNSNITLQGKPTDPLT